MIRASAVGGIVMFWTYFTLNAFKICKEIVFPPKFECAEKKKKSFLQNVQKKKKSFVLGAKNLILMMENMKIVNNVFLMGWNTKSFFAKIVVTITIEKIFPEL